MRSRTGSLPRSSWRATRASPPMASAVSLRARTSSTSGPQSWRFGLSAIAVTLRSGVRTYSRRAAGGLEQEASATLPLRLTLLRERGDALCRILGCCRDREHRVEEPQSILGRLVPDGVERVATELHHGARLGSECRREVVHRRVQVVDGHDP